MKKSKFIVIIFCIVGLFISSCLPGKDDPARWNEHSTIKFYNNSERNLLLNFSIYYPDTSLFNSEDCACGSVKPNTTCHCLNEKGWESEIKMNKHGIILFFLYDLDTLRKYGPDICKNEYKILKRYELTQQMLENSNWTINYP